MKRPVIHLPDPLLRQPAQSFASVDRASLEELFDEMVATMRKLRGIGLAATQIGLNRQIAVIELKDGPLALVNPEISKISREVETDEEGCLSVPGVFGMVPRAAALTLEARDLDGKKYRVRAEGLFARVIQHEVDHLHGKLFIDRWTSLTSGRDLLDRFKLSAPS